MIYHQPTNSRKNFNYNAFVYTDTVWSSHFHGNYELIYVMEGTVPLVLNGAEITLDTGELILLSPYVVHSFSVFDGARAWVGVFSNDFISAFSAKNEGVQFSKFRCHQEIENFLLKALFFEGQPEHYLCIACLYMVCGECVKRAEAMGGKSDRKFMNDIIDYISQNLNYDIRLKDIAKYYNYEYHYCSAVFHQCFSMNFKAFLNIFRIEKACDLLTRDKEDITEVYKECGFASIRNFNRVFKELMGCTPSEYRSGRAKR